MKDELFGTLNWSVGDAWEGAWTFPALRKFGRELDRVDEPDTSPTRPPETGPTKLQLKSAAALTNFENEMGGEEGRILAQTVEEFAANNFQVPESQPVLEKRPRWTGQVQLHIDTNGHHFKPFEAHCAAWNALVRREKTLWEEVAQQALKHYRRQRKMRRAVWKRTYGSYLLERRFPDITTAEAMKKYIRPNTIYLNRVDKGAAMAMAGVSVDWAWNEDGFYENIWNGGIETSDRRENRIPVFGNLHKLAEPNLRVKTSTCRGTVRFDSFLDFVCIADERAEYQHERAKADPPASRIRWEFAEGKFELFVNTTRDQPPSAAQRRLFSAFLAGRKALAERIIQALFDRYQSGFERNRQAYDGRYLDDVIPPITSPRELRDLVKLCDIVVDRPKRNGGVPITFRFVCTWEGSGLTITWRNGKLGRWHKWFKSDY